MLRSLVMYIFIIHDCVINAPSNKSNKFCSNRSIFIDFCGAHSCCEESACAQVLRVDKHQQIAITWPSQRPLNLFFSFANLNEHLISSKMHFWNFNWDSFAYFCEFKYAVVEEEDEGEAAKLWLKSLPRVLLPFFSFSTSLSCAVHNSFFLSNN